MHFGQKGSALFLILIAVALFAALSYAITSSGRGSGSLTKEDASISAAQITQQAAMMAQGVMRMSVMGLPLENLSFEETNLTGYAHTPVVPIQNRLFAPEGGGVLYTPPRTSWFADATLRQWAFPGNTCVTGLPPGPGGQGGQFGYYCYQDAARTDMIAALPEIREDICLAINQGLGITGSIPVDTGCGF